MKKIIGGLVMITLISVLSGCGLKKSSVNNPLSGKDTDQRIVMCLNNAYREHNFKVVKSFDKRKNEGTFEDENGLEFKVRDLIYNNTFDSKTSLKDKIVTELIKSFDKKFLLQNMKFRSQIMDILDYYDITRNKLKFQFIPADRITIFKINDDEQNKGTSILDGSLYYGNLYLSLLEFTLLTYFNNGNDVKYHYVRQTGLDSRTAFNRIEEAKREIQNRSIKAHELTDATSVLSKAGSGTERFIQVGKSDIRPMETDIIQGQNVDFNSNDRGELKLTTDVLSLAKATNNSEYANQDILIHYEKLDNEVAKQFSSNISNTDPSRFLTLLPKHVDIEVQVS